MHPPDVVRHDDDDAYLVVAADKGTAHLSDTANSVSAQYGFWLGDAFASGGSNGYDHKREGITARGAWECIRHHFRNLGLDVQTQPFTCVGIGDMAGDVFGNGLLRSKAMRLVAAFNHQHLFLDPTPDPEKSFAERDAAVRAAALVVEGLRPGGDQRGRRHLRARRQGSAAQPAGAHAARPRGRGAERRGGGARDPVRAGRPALQRRHRHLRQGVDRGGRRRRRSRERSRPRRRHGGPGPGHRRRRQPRPDAAGAPRVLAARRQPEHRRHRQLRRRRHVGSRGQHQDPARRAAARRAAREPHRPQRPAARDDRQRVRAGAGRQPAAGAGADARRPAQRRGLRELRRVRPGAGRRRADPPRRRRRAVARRADGEPGPRAGPAASAARAC